MLLTLILADQLNIYQSSVCGFDCLLTLFLLFCSIDPSEMVSTRMQEMRPLIPYSMTQTLQEGRWSDLFPTSVLIKAMPLRLSMSCQLVLHFRAQYQ